MILPDDYKINLYDVDKMNPWNWYSLTRLYNLYDDFHLIPKTRPLIVPPTPKTSYVDIPGGDGSLDFTEALNGYPVFNSRSGSWEFYVENTTPNDWNYWYSKLLSCIHGKRFAIELIGYNTSTTNTSLGDNMIFIGRLTVNSWKSDKDWSTVVIDYNIEPYAMSMRYGIRYMSSATYVVDDVNETMTVDVSNLCIITDANCPKSFFTQPICPWFCPHSYPAGPAPYEQDYNFTIHFTNSDLGIDYTNTYLIQDIADNGKPSKKEYWFQDPNIILYSKDPTSTTNMTMSFVWEVANESMTWSTAKSKYHQCFVQWMPGRF